VTRIINETCAGFKERPGIVETLAERYRLAYDQTVEWFGLTQWACDGTVEREQLQNIIDTLGELGQLERSVRPEDCLAD
jgi:hypothetical protein